MSLREHDKGDFVMKGSVCMGLCAMALGCLWTAQGADVRWVEDGVIGQSQGADAEPFPRIGLTVAGGRGGCVYLDGAWRVRRGSRTPEKLARTVPFPLVSDGDGLYCFNPNRSELMRVAETEEGLAYAGVALAVPKFEWNARWAVAPADVTGSFARRAKFAVLDRKTCRAYGFAADGSPLGVLVDYSDMPKSNQVQSVGFFAETGDLLLGTGYPERKTHRFGADGREIRDAAWPAPMEAGAYRLANGRTWALSQRVQEVTRNAAARRHVGGNVDTMNSIAWTGDGYWLGTSRGAEFFPSDGSEEPACCLGGCGAVESLAILDGRVFATVGRRICAYWLDDRPGEAMWSDDFQLWHLAMSRDGRVLSVGLKDGKLAYRYAVKNGAEEWWLFDYRFADWTHRPQRLHKCDKAPEGVRSQQVKLPGDCAVSAAEGRWAVGYSPSRQAIVRFRREEVR